MGERERDRERVVTFGIDTYVRQEITVYSSSFSHFHAHHHHARVYTHTKK